MNNVAELNFGLAQRDADRIKEQADKIIEQEKIIQMERKLVKQEKAQLYRDMKAKLDAVKAEYASYKKLAQLEVDVAHATIDRQKQIH